MEGIADAIGTAVREFGSAKAVALFIVQPNEKNSYDQQVTNREAWCPECQVLASALLHCSAFRDRIMSLATLRIMPRKRDIAASMEGVPDQHAVSVQWLQHTLWDRHRVRTLRLTLAEIADRGTLEPSGQLKVDGLLVAVAYFRAGYAPTDYPSDAEWQARCCRSSQVLACSACPAHNGLEWI
jgi:hypothetical protein